MKPVDLSRRLALTLAFGTVACPGQAFAQDSGFSLVGAWTSQVQNPSMGGTMTETDVYNPDGTGFATIGLPDGHLIRIFIRYQARQTGPGQVQVDTQVVGFLPRRICSGGPGGGCKPFNLPQVPTTTLLTVLDQNTFQGNGLTSHRDFAPTLAQATVPETDMAAGPDPTPAPMPSGGADLCLEGTQRCDISGWVEFCERQPIGGTSWMHHALRCREGYGKPEY